MLSTIVLTAALATMLAAQTDKTLPVQKGTRLELRNYAGEVVISGWDQDQVQVSADHGSQDQVIIEASPKLISIEAKGRLSRPTIVDYALKVPRWMSVSVEGPYSDIRIDGVQAEIMAQTVEGDVQVRGGRGVIKLTSVEGEVLLEGGQGTVEASSVDDGVRIMDTVGPLVVETIGGDIIMRRVQSKQVEANTVDGDILYDGSIDESGVYQLGAHDGDLFVVMPDHPDVQVSVAVLEGDFECDFPIQTVDKSKKGKRFRFVLGSGSAQLELESFAGAVWLKSKSGWSGSDSMELQNFKNYEQLKSTKKHQYKSSSEDDPDPEDDQDQ